MANSRSRNRRRANRRPTPPETRTRAPAPTSPRRRVPPAPPPPTGFRGGLERASLPLLTHLSRLPRWLVGVVPGVLLLGGLLLPPPWGILLLSIVTLFLAWLLTLSWPRLQSRSRALRTGVVLLLAALTVAYATGLL